MNDGPTRRALVMLALCHVVFDVDRALTVMEEMDPAALAWMGATLVRRARAGPLNLVQHARLSGIERAWSVLYPEGVGAAVVGAAVVGKAVGTGLSVEVPPSEPATTTATTAANKNP